MFAFNALLLFAVIAKREVQQAVRMLSSFKEKLEEKRAVTGARPPLTEIARVGSSSKNPKKRSREGSNIAWTYRAVGEMPTPTPRRAPVEVEAARVVEDVQIVVTVPVVAAEESSLTLLGVASASLRQ